MRHKTKRNQGAAERTIKDIRRRTRKRYSSEEKIRMVLAGLRGEDSIAELCRQEGIAQGLYYSWSKEFLEAGKKRLARAHDCRVLSAIQTSTSRLRQALSIRVSRSAKTIRKAVPGIAQSGDLSSLSHAQNAKQPAISAIAAPA